jgi:glycosyltransferase involved in cell wall biosynthesis
VTDQRVHRAATTLSQYYEVIVVGRKLQDSQPMLERPYQTRRMNLIFTKGPLFYSILNMRLFFFLLFHRVDLLLANDLDTLLPNFIVSKIKGIELYYDTHEYFTGVPELQDRPVVKSIWETIEKVIFPGIKHVYTVNKSIADLYNKKYGVEVNVVRNVPLNLTVEKLDRHELGLPENRKIIIFQGAGININRGAEEALMAMKYLPDTYILLFIGGGDVFDKLKNLAEQESLNEKIIFIPKVPFERLRQYTFHADLGLTLDKSTNINYRFSLPNKVFDYIHSGVPVLSSNLVEIENIINEYDVGKVISSHEPEVIARNIENMLNSPHYPIWKNNTIIAARELNWDVEKSKLLEIFSLNN